MIDLVKNLILHCRLYVAYRKMYSVGMLEAWSKSGAYLPIARRIGF